MESLASTNPKLPAHPSPSSSSMATTHLCSMSVSLSNTRIYHKAQRPRLSYKFMFMASNRTSDRLGGRTAQQKPAGKTPMSLLDSIKHKPLPTWGLSRLVSIFPHFLPSLHHLHTVLGTSEQSEAMQFGMGQTHRAVGGGGHEHHNAVLCVARHPALEPCEPRRCGSWPCTVPRPEPWTQTHRRGGTAWHS